MRRTLALALLALSAVALLATAPALAQANVAAAIGVNAAIRNQVSMKTAADAAPRPAVLRESVHLADQISSGPASQLQVLLRDRSIFTIGANARMAIDTFVYDPARGTGDLAASVAKGAFRFMSGRTLSKTGGTTAVRTPVASIGVRGTIVEGVVGDDAILTAEGEPGVPKSGSDPQTATLIVLRGPGPRTDGLDKPGSIEVTSGGKTVLIDKPGYAVFIPGPGQPPIGPFLMSAEAFARLADLLRPPPTGKGGDEGPFDIASASVASGEILQQAEFSAHVVYDPVFTELPVVRSDDLGVPCAGGSGGGKVCPQ
ncbi:FecR domain-containing protein [Sphingosinicellaceae bacterium]|nr:FecR domain-containing protein [Sphingosinicellaceae bacterium]